MWRRTYVSLTLTGLTWGVLLAFGPRQGLAQEESPGGSPAPQAPHERRSRPLLFGGDLSVPLVQVTYDARLPEGELLVDASAAPLPQNSAESSRFPLRVEGGSARQRVRALELLEDAYVGVWASAGSRLGGELPLLWYLDERQSDPDFTVKTAPRLDFDRGQAVCRGGALNDRSARWCASGGAALGRAPAAAIALVEGFARAVALEAGAPTEADAAWLTAINEHPEEPVVSRQPDSPERNGSALFFSYLSDEDAKSKLEVGALALGLGATLTPSGALRYRGRPDIFDVMRVTLGSREGMARFLSALTETRVVDGGARLVGGLPSRAMKVSASVKASSLPRHISLPNPMGPTGGAALAVELDTDPGLLALRIYCELPVMTVWSVLRFDEHNALRGRVAIPFREAASEFAQRVSTEGAHRLVVVGTNLGGVDLAHPYDPDHAPHEKHACSIAVDVLGL